MKIYEVFWTVMFPETKVKHSIQGRYGSRVWDGGTSVWAPKLGAQKIINDINPKEHKNYVHYKLCTTVWDFFQ